MAIKTNQSLIHTLQQDYDLPPINHFQRYSLTPRSMSSGYFYMPVIRFAIKHTEALTLDQRIKKYLL